MIFYIFLIGSFCAGVSGGDAIVPKAITLSLAVPVCCLSPFLIYWWQKYRYREWLRSYEDVGRGSWRWQR
ncbi:hypothetical protein B0J14DRAFT_585974 [Halenospora varia]|nr:hypothetical protein B0J14DRAFT_585974 [Halenospora varia]